MQWKWSDSNRPREKEFTGERKVEEWSRLSTFLPFAFIKEVIILKSYTFQLILHFLSQKEGDAHIFHH